MYITFCRKLYPELKENLEQFRTHLKESAHEMAPLKVWQLQGTYRLLHRKCDVRIFIHELQDFGKRTSERSERVSFPKS